jgi:hypothetical protein
MKICLPEKFLELTSNIATYEHMWWHITIVVTL